MLARYLVGIAVLTCAVTSVASVYRAAILDEPSLPVTGFPTPVETFRTVLTAEGVPLTSVNAEQSADANVFNADAFDLLIVPTGASFPAAARDTLLAFLEKGGDLFCTGGYAFDSLWNRRDGQWVSCHDEWLRQREATRRPDTSLIANGGFENASEHWKSSSPQTCSVVTEGAFSGQACGQASNVGLGGDVVWETLLDVQPGQTYCVGAHAKTCAIQGSGFAFLAVYQHDAQGGLVKFIDFAQIRTVSDWTRYETCVEIAPNVTRVILKAGLYQCAGTLWIDEATCANLPPETLINAHYGKPEDGLLLGPRQLMLFNSDQHFAGESYTLAKNGPLASDMRVQGTLLGFEATAQLGGEARWIPLIEAHDKYDRFSGIPGALVFHTAAPFKDSVWALFGVTNRDLFANTEGQQLLRDTIRILRTGVFIESARTEKPRYAAREDVSIEVAVRNTSSVSRRVAVQAGIAEKDMYSTYSSQEIEVTAGSAGRLRFSGAPSTSTPLTEFIVSTDVDGRCVDKQEGGFCFAPDELQSVSDNVREPAELSPRYRCRFGTDAYCNVFMSRSYSPLTWRRDAKMMRDFGLDMFENLQMTPPDYVYTEDFDRQIGSYIHLTTGDSHHALDYMAGLLIGGNVVVSDAELAQQAAMCQRFAAQHKNVTYYLNGDFRLELKDIPDMRRLWNTFLSAHYAGDEAIRAAWNPPPQEPLGNIPVKDWPAQSWYDVRARDVALFKTELMRRWIGALCQAIRIEEPHASIVSEYYQRPFNGIDLRLTCGDLTEVNFGYFDEPKRDVARLLATIKWNDVRQLGKRCNVGEFGVKTHDAWAKERGGNNYHVQRTDEERNALFWWMAHAAVGMDLGRIQNWCWSDDPDRVFPWGLAYVNPSRPKPILKLYRNLRMLAAQQDSSRTSSGNVLVLPDTWRCGAPESVAYSSLMNAIQCLLAANVSFDTVNQTRLVGMGVSPPAAILMPLAYALDDTSFAALLEAAEHGAVVYLSGDPSISESGQRDPARLERAFDLRFVREEQHVSGLPYPVVEGSPEKITGPLPCALYSFARGKGRILWAPEPWETLPGKDLFVDDALLASEPASNAYFALSKCLPDDPCAPYEATNGIWNIFVEGPIVFFPLSTVGPGTRVTTRVHRYKDATITIEPKAALPSLVGYCDGAIAASGTGSLTIDDGTFVEGDGAWMIFTLEKRPLTESAQLALASTAQGAVSWNSSATDLHAWMVEWQDGAGRVVGSVPFTQMEKGWRIEVEPNELYVIAQREPSEEVFEILRNGVHR